MPILERDVIPNLFLPQITALREAIFNRILPAFDRLDAEAKEIEQEAWEGFNRHAGEDDDPASLAEAAFEQGLEHFEIVSSTLQTIMNVFAVGIEHMFEQQRHLLSFRTLNDYEPDSRKREVGFRALLAEHGIDASRFPQAAKLEELHCVANVAKHAEGRAAARLRELRPELFTHPSIREGPLGRLPPPWGVNSTLIGDDLFVEPDDLRHYLDAVKAFWEFVLEQIPEPRAGPLAL